MGGSEIHWLALREIDGVSAFRVGVARDDTLIAEWIGLARLTCDRSGARSQLEYTSSLSATARKKIEDASTILLEQVFGGLAFHSSCVVLGGQALLLTGRSGAGKSTLAAWLVEHAMGSMVSDDLTPIEERADGRWVAKPFESASWLDGPGRALVTGKPDGGQSKQPLTAPRVSEDDAPLAGIIELVFDGDVVSPRLSPLVGMGAIGVLVPQIVRFVIDEPQRQQRELDTLISIAKQVPILRLERRRDLHGFAAVHRVVDAWMSSAILK